MSTSATCVKCGSADIIRSARVMDRANNGFAEYDLRLRVDADPNAFVFTGTTRCPMEAHVCGQCGYIEFYATDPSNLLAAWRHSRETEKG